MEGNLRLVMIKYLGDLGLEIDSFSENDFGITMIIKVWVKPGAKKEKISVSNTGELIISISERPVEGRANKALIKMISRSFGIQQTSISLKTGEKSKHKSFSLHFEFTKKKNSMYYLDKFKKVIS